MHEPFDFATFLATLMIPVFFGKPLQHKLSKMESIRQIGKAVKTTGVKSNELFGSPLKFIIDISKAASVWSMVQQDSVNSWQWLQTWLQM